VYRHRPVIPTEQVLIDEHVRPGTRVLDVGTAATGRSATMLRDAGAEVHSIEINEAALVEFLSSDDRHGIQLAVADMVRLPFADESFDAVVIGLHGSDYLLDRTARAQAFGEAGRVLRSGGVLMFNAFNPAGLSLSPSGLGSAEFRRLRARYLLGAGFLRRSLVDINGLRLHQATPRRIVGEVEQASPLTLTTVTNQSGSSRRRWLVALLASAPY
jgi:ubiquinone/menaquinone biosynthesis C-methylase UbiE